MKGRPPNWYAPEWLDDCFVEDVVVACDAVPVDTQPEERPDVPDVLAFAPLVSAVASLPDRLRFVVLSRLVRDWTNEYVGSLLGVSRQRVDQLFDEAIDKLRHRPEVVEVLRGRRVSAVAPSAVRLSRERVTLINRLMERALGPVPRTAVDRYKHTETRRDAILRRRHLSAEQRRQLRDARAAKQARVRLVIERHLAARAA